MYNTEPSVLDNVCSLMYDKTDVNLPAK